MPRVSINRLEEASQVYHLKRFVHFNLLVIQGGEGEHIIRFIIKSARHYLFMYFHFSAFYKLSAFPTIKAILSGYAPDGGLYVPHKMPSIKGNTRQTTTAGAAVEVMTKTAANYMKVEGQKENQTKTYKQKVAWASGCIYLIKNFLWRFFACLLERKFLSMISATLSMIHLRLLNMKTLSRS